MINISDIIKIGASSTVIDLKKAQHRQRVLGVPHLEGIYVDHAFFEEVCIMLREKDIWQIKVSNLIRNRRNATLERRFLEVDSSRYIILVTELLNPNMILLRAADRFINSSMLQGLPQAWNQPHKPEEFIPLEDALSICSHSNLASLLDRLLQTETVSETQSTVVDNAESIRTTTSYRRLEDEHYQESELKFYFGSRRKPHKRTLAERCEDAVIHEQSASKPAPPSVTDWLADTKSNRSFTRHDIR